MRDLATERELGKKTCTSDKNIYTFSLLKKKVGVRIVSGNIAVLMLDRAALRGVFSPSCQKYIIYNRYTDRLLVKAGSKVYKTSVIIT